MNPIRLITMLLGVLVCEQALAQVQDVDKELASLAEKLATPIKEHAKKRVAVIDFTDLQGTPSGELGRYIAEQLTVNFVLLKRDFTVLDRANLSSILAEHKLTATGLVNPDNAKKLGMFAGVDAFILGTIIPKATVVNITAKIITTDTAEVIGAARAEFKADSSVQELLSHPATKGGGLPDLTKTEQPPAFGKSFGDLRVELDSLRIVNGSDFLLNLVFTNQSANKSVWVALNSDMGVLKSKLIDSGGHECHPLPNSTSGIQTASYQRYGYDLSRFSPSTEIKPSDAIAVSLRFASIDRSEPKSGPCSVQLEFLLGQHFDRTTGTVTVRNLSAKLDAQAP